MNRLKYVTAFFLFVFSFILNSELLQNYLHFFTSEFYYIEIDYSDRTEIYNVLDNISEKQHIPVFSISTWMPTYQNSEISVFANNSDFKVLSQKCDIGNCTYSSFISGNTTIVHHDLREIIDHPEITRFYFIISSKKVDLIYSLINQHITTSYVHKEDNLGIEKLLFVPWIISFLFLTVFTWFCIQINKKRFFVRISLGFSKLRIISSNIIWDICIMLFEFIFIYFNLRKFCYIDKNLKEITALFLAFLLFDSILYFSILKNPYKEIIYGANLNQTLLSHSYLIKAVVMILAIASLSINFFLVIKNYNYLKYYSAIDQLSNEYFLNVLPDYKYYNSISNDSLITDSQKISIYDNVLHSIIWDSIYDNNLRYVDISLEDSNKNKVIICNDKSLIVTPQLSDMIDEKKDFTVLYPKYFPNELMSYDTVTNVIKSQLGLLPENYTISFTMYDFNSEVLYFNLQEGGTTSKIGFDAIKKPAVIYCNLNGEEIKQKQTLSQNLLLDNGEFNLNVVRFNLDFKNLELLSTKYHLSECSFTSVPDQFKKIKKTMLRILIINTSISIMIFMIDILTIIMIIKFEYIINAKRLCVKKILGYSVFMNNLSIFGLNLFSTCIGIISNFIGVLMFKYSRWYIVIIIGILILIVEFLIIIKNIYHIESINTANTLKGGCL